MEYISLYIEGLVAGNEATAIWLMIAFAAIWGCLLGVTGVLAIRKQRAKGQSR